VRAARLHGTRDIRVADEPAPALAADQTLLRVTAVGICGSEVVSAFAAAQRRTGLKVLVTP